MRIAIISGSARENNNTIRVAKAIKRLHHEHEVQVVDFAAYDIPWINQASLIPEQLSDFQQKLVNTMDNASIIYIITPEYNWSTTPEILNWLHRFGDKNWKHLFNEKVFALVGVSTGKGGKAPVLHLVGILHKIISFLNLDSVISPKIFESHYTKQVLDEEGNSTGNVEYDNGLQTFTDYTLRVAKRWFH